MAVARHHQRVLPRLARCLCSDEDTYRLFCELCWLWMNATVVAVFIAGIGARVFADEIEDSFGGVEVRTEEFWGWPVFAIGEEARGWISMGERPVGVVAIGWRHAVGVIAIAPAALGVVAIGAIGIGVVSTGVLALGLLCWGGCAIGLGAVGGIAVGRLAFGAIGVGWYACATLAVGAYARGMTALGLFRAESRIPIPHREPPGKERLLFRNWGKRDSSG